MARRVDYIYLGPLVLNGRIFRIYRNAALLLERVAVHRYPLFGGTRLPQERVGERRFPMVHMGDNGYVANFHGLQNKMPRRRGIPRL